MDVQADEASVGADPSPAVAGGASASAPPGAVRAVHQGSFFQDDPYPTFADTDPTPMVARTPSRRSSSGSRGLRIAVVVVALAVLAAGAALALVKTGVINTTSKTPGAQSSAPPPPPPVTRTTAAPKATLLTPAGFGAANAAYTVNGRVFGLTVTTTTGRSWVSVGIVGQKPIFEGILAANSSQHVTLLGPAQLDVGAGGTTVTVTSAGQSQVLTPPSAPYSYQFTPR